MVNDLLQRRLHDSESTGSRTGEDLASVRKEAADLATERAQLERAVADFQAQQVRSDRCGTHVSRATCVRV